MEQEGLNYGWEWENRLKEEQHTEKNFYMSFGNLYSRSFIKYTHIHI